jgi:hypothetical protein
MASNVPPPDESAYMKIVKAVIYTILAMVLFLAALWGLLLFL